VLYSERSGPPSKGPTLEIPSSTQGQNLSAAMRLDKGAAKRNRILFKTRIKAVASPNKLMRVSEEAFDAMTQIVLKELERARTQAFLEKRVTILARDFGFENKPTKQKKGNTDV